MTARMLREPIPDLWNPTRDRVGTAGGVDLEPLQAGMAEIALKQHDVDAPSAGREEVVAAAPTRMRRAARGTGAREGAHVWCDVDLLIAEEVEDYEIEAACEKPRAAA